ncbi:MAG: hypothetical protein PHP22_11050 [Oscillospiraceae bacterium]|nr:hypothetical protein [Oscillospiraceae bacterium]
MEKGTYRSSFVKTFLWVLLISLVPESACFGVIATTRQSDQQSIAIVVAAVVIPVISILCTLFFMITIRVSNRDVQFFRFGRSYRTLPFEKYTFSEYVYKLTINSIFPISIRNLRVTNSTGVIHDYLCYGFSVKTFDSLLDEITERNDYFWSVSGDRRDPAGLDSEFESFENNEIESYNPAFRINVFSFPRDTLHKILVQHFIAAAVLSVLLIPILALVVGCVFLWDAIWTYELFYSLIAPGGVVLIIIIIAVFFQWLLFRKRSKQIPRTIRITDNTLQIDDRVFSIGDIHIIKMTPVNYVEHRAYRKLRIESAGQSIEYILGHIGNQRGFFRYPQYESLYTAIDDLMLKAGKNVVAYTF